MGVVGFYDNLINAEWHPNSNFFFFSSYIGSGLGVYIADI